LYASLGSRGRLEPSLNAADLFLQRSQFYPILRDAEVGFHKLRVSTQHVVDRRHETRAGRHGEITERPKRIPGQIGVRLNS
jgi:hypothetical protein